MKRDVKMWGCGWCGKMCFLYSSSKKPEHCPYGLPGSAFSQIGQGVSEIVVAKQEPRDDAKAEQKKGDAPRKPDGSEHFVYKGEFVFEGKTFKFPKFYPGRAVEVRRKGPRLADLCYSPITYQTCDCSSDCEQCLLSGHGGRVQNFRAFDAFIEELGTKYGNPLFDDVIPAGANHPAFMVGSSVREYGKGKGVWCGGASCSGLRPYSPSCTYCLLCCNRGDPSEKISAFESLLTSYGIKFKSRKS